MEWLTAILGSLGSGGLTGIIGGLVTLWKGHQDNKLVIERMKIENAQEIAILDAEHRNLMTEIEGNLNVVKEEGKTRQKESDDDLFEAGMRFARTEIGDTKNEGIVLRFVEGCRRFFRPFASYYSIIVISLMSWWVYGLWEEMQLALTQQQAYELTVLMLETMIYMSTTVVFWWFTTRVGKPTIMLGKDK